MKIKFSIFLQIENIRREKIINNIDDEKDPDNLFKKQEDDLINKFNKFKGEISDKYKSMQNFESEIKTIKAELDVYAQRRTKDFQMFKEVMLKKVAYEDKHGSLNNVLNKSNQ